MIAPTLHRPLTPPDPLLQPPRPSVGPLSEPAPFRMNAAQAMTALLLGGALGLSVASMVVGASRGDPLWTAGGLLAGSLIVATLYLDARNQAPRIRVPRAASMPGQTVCAPRPRLRGDEQARFDRCERLLGELCRGRDQALKGIHVAQYRAKAAVVEKLLQELPYFDQSQPVAVESLPLVQRMSSLRLKHLFLYFGTHALFPSGADWGRQITAVVNGLRRQSLAIGVHRCLPGPSPV
mgnify:CR=1 FL=1